MVPGSFAGRYHLRACTDFTALVKEKLTERDTWQHNQMKFVPLLKNGITSWTNTIQL